MARRLRKRVGMRRLTWLFPLLLLGCGSATDSPGDSVDGGALCAEDTEDIERPAHWAQDSHCKGVDPAYDLLFDDTKVQRIDITISPENHQIMQDDLDQLLGGGGGPGPISSGDDPVWVPVTVQHDGNEWTQVGMRYKGNSSLHSSYRTGIQKLAFRLTFDKYEADHPELVDQRFYGFKKMTFANGFNDPSLMRDKLAADIFRAGGVPAARGAFTRVYVDVGDGPVYFGLYTMIEDPSNKMIDTQFADGTGNLYKPEGNGARLGAFDEVSFEKKTNEDDGDYSDVQALITALNASRSDAAAWRANLEAVFDVAGFLRWLALNQVMVNWDTYGWAPHNFYLYADPSASGRIVYIPWDLNEALLIRSGGGPGGDRSTSASVTLDEIGSEWPLIRNLLDDPVYAATYRAELQTALSGAYATDSVFAKIDAYHALIAPYVVGADGESAPYSHLRDSSAFDSSISTGRDALKPHIEARHVTVQAALQ